MTYCLGILLRSGLVASADDIPAFVESQAITVSGGLNRAKAPWNNTTLRALVWSVSVWQIFRHAFIAIVVLFAAGTGNPYFSTDTAAVLRAIQIKANLIIKATSVDGVYTADPKKEKDAKLYDEISYRDVMMAELKVMDQTAITLCKENHLPLIVLNIHRPGAIAAAVRGDRVGTLVR